MQRSHGSHSLRSEPYGRAARENVGAAACLQGPSANSACATKNCDPGTIPSADADPRAQTWSGWSVTPEVIGVDGVPRRWVFLHVFKPAQPTLNWLDPSFAAYRVNYGDTARHIVDRGTKVLRLDAAPFLGIDPDTNDAMAQTYLQPFSIDGTNDLAYMARKSGGWTFQELNLPVEQLTLRRWRGSV